MTRPVAALLPGGDRLHLQHGPIDLIIRTDENRDLAYRAATERFETILQELVKELEKLRLPMTSFREPPNGSVARRMHEAALPHCNQHFITRMAAVAGAVADEILDAMKKTTFLGRAYVNNGGDIALHLEPGKHFTLAMAGHDGSDLGRILVNSDDGIGGIATSSRHGRSFSLGIADSVTVLARCAGEADAAATLIANAVDLPGHPAISRKEARLLNPDSDLGELLVVTQCEKLPRADRMQALESGRVRAEIMLKQRLIAGAALFLEEEACIIGNGHLELSERRRQHA